jgi:transaldolase
MRPNDLQTRIFLDGGDPDETKEIIEALGFIDGQTTNPSLISRNPEAKERLEAGETFSRTELLNFYKEVVQETSKLVPQDGSVSIEVYADAQTTADDMLEQAQEMFSWIPNAHIKFPTTTPGLSAASQAIEDGMRVNMTLCFSQQQAAAVHAATEGAKRGDVFVSPFIGRLDDRGLNGMQLIENILKMYDSGDGHVEVLAASVRHYEHLLRILGLECDIVTAPFDVLKEWGDNGLEMPGESFTYSTAAGKDPIPYKEIILDQRWQTFNITHPQTDEGQAKFAEDWNTLLGA